MTVRELVKIVGCYTFYSLKIANIAIKTLNQRVDLYSVTKNLNFV